MVKVKTFTSPLKIFHVHNELMSLDKEVNELRGEVKVFTFTINKEGRFCF